MLLLFAGVFFVTPQFIRVVLISVPPLSVISPLPLMPVPVSGPVPAVSLPGPLPRSVSLFLFAFLLPLSGPGPGLGSPPLSVPRPVSVSALLRPWLRSRFASLGGFTFFFFLGVILNIKIKKLKVKSNYFWTHLAVSCLSWVFLLILPGQSCSLLQLFSDDLLMVDGYSGEPEPADMRDLIQHNNPVTATHLVSNHSSLVIIALIISPIVMIFPPPAFTSISWEC